MPAPDRPQRQDFAAGLSSLSFTQIAGWRQDDHALAFAAFLRSAHRIAETPPKRRHPAVDLNALDAVARHAIRSGPVTGDAARRFLKTISGRPGSMPMGSSPAITSPSLPPARFAPAISPFLSIAGRPISSMSMPATVRRTGIGKSALAGRRTPASSPISIAPRSKAERLLGKDWNWPGLPILSMPISFMFRGRRGCA